MPSQTKKPPQWQQNCQMSSFVPLLQNSCILTRSKLWIENCYWGLQTTRNCEGEDNTLPHTVKRLGGKAQPNFPKYAGHCSSGASSWLGRSSSSSVHGLWHTCPTNNRVFLILPNIRLPNNNAPLCYVWTTNFSTIYCLLVCVEASEEPGDCIEKKNCEHMNHQLNRQRAIYDRRVLGKPFESWNLAWLYSPATPRSQCRKFHQPWTGPLRIAHRLSHVTHHIQMCKLTHNKL